MSLQFKSEDFLKIVRREKFASPADLCEHLAIVANRRLAEIREKELDMFMENVKPEMELELFIKSIHKKVLSNPENI